MKICFRSATAALMLLLSSGILSAQEVVASGGDFLENENGSLSITFGELAIETLESSNAILTQGFQQSKLSITMVEEFNALPFIVSIYPNPTTSFVRISAKTSEFPQLDYRITDVSGKILSNGKIMDSEQYIHFEQLPAGTYFLQLLGSENKRDTYKIIKQ